MCRVCVVYVSCVCQREIALGSNGKDSPAGHPRLGGNRGVREGGWEATKCRGKMMMSVLDEVEGLQG